MRPRVFPAEDSGLRVTGFIPAIGFNEAAGIPRGRRTARNPLRSKVVHHWIARGRAIAKDEQSLTPWNRPWKDYNYPVVKDLHACEHSLAFATALERSLPRGGMVQTITASRRTASNFLPRLTTRGSTPSATPMSTSTTWSSE